MLSWLLRTAATVFAITVLSALGAAVFALLCGALGWVLHVERAPVGFLWLTASGAIAGFLAGCGWAIDRITNRRIYFSLSQDDARRSALPSLDGKAGQPATRNERLKKTVEIEAPVTGPLLLSSPLRSSRWSRDT
ncbi:MAG TPA: hypothetical protein VMG10_06285 [Gemmataceae bacterium]|nr:hypothetical protein [Gemmataceae bacterium]